MVDGSALLSFLAATAAGLLIGIERGWRLRGEAAGSRVAGVRTFTLLGLTGGFAGFLSSGAQPAASAIVLATGAGVLLVGHWRQTKASGQGDATSAVAALMALTLGYVAGLGEPALAVAASAVVTLVLALRRESHGLIDKLDQDDVKALARFSVIALAVLPFLPNADYGPYGAWNPQHLWWVVVLVTGFSFAGYIANRVFGERHGTIATALIGGAYSSTAVTQTLSQRLAKDSEGGAEAAGIALASAVMYLRVMVLVAVLAPRLLIAFSLVVGPALLVAWAAGFWLFRSAKRSQGAVAPGNPIAMVPAFGFLLFVAFAAVAAAWAQKRFGEQGIAVLLTLMGVMDVDAAIVTAGTLEPSQISNTLAALAIAGTIVGNMAVKIGVVLVNARSKGKRAALALLASTVALALTIIFGFLFNPMW